MSKSTDLPSERSPKEPVLRPDNLHQWIRLIKIQLAPDYGEAGIHLVTEVKPDFMTQTFTQLYPNYPLPLPKQVGLEMAEEYKMDRRRYKSDIEASKRMILDVIMHER